MPLAAAIPMAGKLMPFLLKAGSAAKMPLILRGAGALGGAAPGIMEGDLGKAVLGGGLGAATTYGMGGLATGLSSKAAGAAMGGLGKAGLATIPGVAAAVPALANVAVPAAVGLGVGGATAALGSGPAASGLERGAGVGAMALQNQGNYSGVNSQANAIPQLISGDHVRMVQGPDGNIMYQVDPRGLPQGLRYGRGLDTQQNISDMNKWFNARFPQSEAVKQADFGRNVAGAQIRSNIDQARQMALNSQVAPLNVMQQAGADMGQLLNQQYSYV